MPRVIDELDSLRASLQERIITDFDVVMARHRALRRRRLAGAVVAVAAVAAVTVSAAVGIPELLRTSSTPPSGAVAGPATLASLPPGKTRPARTDGYAGHYVRCRAHVRANRLIAPFWLDFTHFDPASWVPQHTPSEVLQKYRNNDPMIHGLNEGAIPQIAFASYSVFEPRRPSRPVWIVVSYGVSAMSSMSSTPFRSDQTIIYSDRNLKPLAVIQALPSRCQ
jgi:hypothetical protein